MEDKQIQIENFIKEGLSQFYSWNHSKAEEAFLKAFAIDPENAEVLYQLGSVYYYQGRIDGAFEYLKKAVRLSPDDAHYHYVLGFALMENNKLEEAAEELERSVAIDDSYTQGYKNLGEIYYLLDDHEKASKSFSVVAERDQYAENFLNQYISLRKSGGKDASLDFLKSSIKKVFKDDPLFLIMRLYLGFIETADVVEKIGERIMPAVLYYHCGMGLIFKGNKDEACEFFKKCIETKCNWVPEYRRAQHELNSCSK